MTSRGRRSRACRRFSPHCLGWGARAQKRGLAKTEWKLLMHYYALSKKKRGGGMGGGWLTRVSWSVKSSSFLKEFGVFGASFLKRIPKDKPKNSYRVSDGTFIHAKAWIQKRMLVLDWHNVLYHSAIWSYTGPCAWPCFSPMFGK